MFRDSHKVISCVHPPGSFCKVPLLKTRKQNQTVTTHVLASLHYLLTLPWRFTFFWVFWLPCPLASSEAWQRSLVGSDYKDCQLFNIRASDENRNCSCSQPNISLHMMFAKSTEVDHSLFIFRKEKTHLWPTFPPTRSYHPWDGATCQQGLSKLLHQALLRKAAQMQLPHYSDL